MLIQPKKMSSKWVILAIQSINFALMQGFLPRFAAEQYVGLNHFSYKRVWSKIGDGIREEYDQQCC